jgi:glycosyltransferase involved in cell wall biosynthesis
VSTENLPLVSIVTPSLNQGEYIRHAVESVLSQDYPHLEYWVMDGGSTDETTTILAQLAEGGDFRWQSRPDQGQAQAIQMGWARSRGDILAWINADDTYLSGAVRAAVTAFQEHPEANIVCGGVQLIDSEGIPTGAVKPVALDLSGLLDLHHYLPQPAVFLRAEAVRSVGGIDASLQYAMDLDLYLRLAACAPIHFLDETLAAHRLHPSSKTMSQHHALRAEAAQVARRFLDQYGENGLYRNTESDLDARRLRSRTHLVEAYADFRRKQYAHSLAHAARALWLQPGNIGLIWQRLRREMGEQT